MADKIPISDDTENEENGQTQVSTEATTDNDKPADATSTESEEDEEASLTDKLAAAEAASSENYDRFLRVSAEFENFKKRSAKEISDAHRFGNESLLKELLHVVDNLERALETCDASHGAAAIREGVELTLKDLLKVFERFSVEVVAAVGTPFDPTYHQAVMQEPSETEADNTVLRELQKGYTLNGRLLRPAMVVVSTSVAKQPDDASKDSEEQS